MRFVVFWSVWTACFVAFLVSGSAVSPSKPVQVGVAHDLSAANRLPAPFDLTHVEGEYLGLVVHTRNVSAPGLEWDWVHCLRVQWGFDTGSMAAAPVFDSSLERPGGCITWR